MIINFLVGSLILRKNKTGVHLFHENLFNKFIEHNEFNIRLSVYEKAHNLNKRYNKKIPYAKYLRYSFKLARLLSYFLPIELLFGKSNIYICDGMIPITIFKSLKIAVIHDLMVFRYPQNYSLIRKIYLKYYFWQSRYKADYIIAVSETTKKDIIKYLGIPSEKIFIVYNGINISKDDINIKYVKGQVLDVKYFYSIGECRPNKNFLTAIKAFEKYKKQNPNQKIFFYLAGNHNSRYGKFLKKYVAEHKLNDYIKFIGYVTEEEKIALYKNANIFIFISEYEGFGVPIIEAMHYGIPVITSNCSSMAEIARRSAILVNPHDQEEIISAFYKLNDITSYNYYKQAGIKCCKSFSWENSYMQFRNKLKEIINE